MRPVSSRSQNWRSSAGRISALQVMALGKGQLAFQEAPALEIAGGFNALLDGLRRLAQAVIAELVVFHAGHLDMDVDAVHERAGDAFLVAGDGGGGAGAGFDGIAVKAARAGVHGSHHHEVGGEGQRALGAADRDGFIFDRLAEDFQDAGAELRQFIEKEHAAVGQRDLAGVRPIAAAHQSSMRDGVVRRAERTVLDQPAHRGGAGRRQNRCGSHPALRRLSSWGG